MTQDNNSSDQTTAQDPASRNPTSEADVQPVEIDKLGEKTQSGGGASLPRSLLDPITLTLTVELGRTQMSFRELQAITQGSVVELDHLVGDPLEIRANGHLVARGEVVAIKQEHYGVRITEVVQQTAGGQGGTSE